VKDAVGQQGATGLGGVHAMLVGLAVVADDAAGRADPDFVTIGKDGLDVAVAHPEVGEDGHGHQQDDDDPQSLGLHVRYLVAG